MCVNSETHTVSYNLENSLTYCCVGDFYLQLQVRWNSKTLCWDNFGTGFCRKWGGTPRPSSKSLASIVSEVERQDLRWSVPIVREVRLQDRRWNKPLQSRVRWLQDLRCGTRSRTLFNRAWGENPRPSLNILVLLIVREVLDSKTVVRIQLLSLQDR